MKNLQQPQSPENIARGSSKSNVEVFLSAGVTGSLLWLKSNSPLLLLLPANGEDWTVMLDEGW